MSFLRSLTLFPLSSTIGLQLNSMSFNAANNPAGPSPTTTTAGLCDTSPYSVCINSSSEGSSLTYILRVKLTKIVRWRASILRFNILIFVIVLTSIFFSRATTSFNVLSL